jgi:indolepyruvate ferredoxin oxidoreductase beta subunit
MNTTVQPIKIAILAMGGEGGGVLADWLVDLGEHNGHIAQTTSVPGVAQRTGATIYYVELFPRAQAEADGGRPVLALMPLPGDVDLVLASELMEAGRAVQRGLVTPDRTTLVASSHRVYAIAEKAAMGDGRADSAELLAHARAAAQRLVCFDMERVAAESGSVISAVLMGALAATGALPFTRAQFEATIERGGVGVKPSLRAFAAGHDAALAPADAAAHPATQPATQPAPSAPTTPNPRDPRVKALLDRVALAFPLPARPIVTEGVRRLIDYQDTDYAGQYLDRLLPFSRPPLQGQHTLLQETARHLALWMSYEDTVRVAELKTRDTRFARVRDEVRVASDQAMDIHEFMHPRLEEICDTLPAGLGRWLAASGWPKRLVQRFTQHGRVVATSSLSGFLLLYVVSGLKRWRRGSLRHAVETQAIEQWLAQLAATGAQQPDLAVELARCQGLVKGYGDTHTRGLGNFRTLMAALQRSGTAIAPTTLRELREAALADEHGRQLQAALQRHALA